MKEDFCYVVFNNYSFDEVLTARLWLRLMGAMVVECLQYNCYCFLENPRWENTKAVPGEFFQADLTYQFKPMLPSISFFSLFSLQLGLNLRHFETGL